MTLARARAVAGWLGITRVTEITRLDRVGVPVFASIRPNALPGSLCVNAGKGVSVMEARVGAYMEAVEFAFAEYGRSGLEVHAAPARQVYEGPDRPDAILDFCPVMRAEVALDATVACVEAADIVSGEKFPVPAELVFLPFPGALRTPRYFSSNSNGLCSGNSVLEATVHGLAEVIERDCISFMLVDDQSRLVAAPTLPPPLRDLAAQVSAAGLELYLRHQSNVFGVPFFRAVVAEQGCTDPVYISEGYGCHLSRDIAATRAVCESLQSRLSFIHGGRDDLIKRYKLFGSRAENERAAYAERLLGEVSGSAGAIDFEETADCSDVATDLASALAVLTAKLAQNGIRRVLRVIYTPADYPVHVARILAPGLECFNHTTARVGLRLRDHVRSRL